LDLREREEKREKEHGFVPAAQAQACHHTEGTPFQFPCSQFLRSELFNLPRSHLSPSFPLALQFDCAAECPNTAISIINTQGKCIEYIGDNLHDVFKEEVLDIKLREQILDYLCESPILVDLPEGASYAAALSAPCHVLRLLRARASAVCAYSASWGSRSAARAPGSLCSAQFERCSWRVYLAHCPADTR